MQTIKIPASVMAAAEQTGDPKEYLYTIIKATPEISIDAKSAPWGQNIDMLMVFCVLMKEVTEGGFIQFIYNGGARYILLSLLPQCYTEWGLDDLAVLLSKASRLYRKLGKQIEHDANVINAMDDAEGELEFMALYEKYPQFDDLDDAFVENEDRWTEQVAQYVREHASEFYEIIDD